MEILNAEIVTAEIELDGQPNVLLLELDAVTGRGCFHLFVPLSNGSSESRDCAGLWLLYQLLETVNAKYFKHLPGTVVRLMIDENGDVQKIGRIIKDDWVSIKIESE